MTEASVRPPLHALRWRPIALPDVTGDSTVVVLAGDDEELIRLLAEQAQGRGLRGAVLTPGSGGLPDDAQAWAAFWAEAPAAGRVALVLAMRPSSLPRELPEPPAAPDIAGTGAALCSRVVTAVLGLHGSGVAGAAFALTRGARQVTGRDAVPATDHGLLHGLAPVLGLELGRSWGGVVDLPAEPGADDAAAALRLAVGGAGEDLVAIRAGDVLAGRLAAIGQDRVEALAVRDSATYLVTGGLGGVGREVVADLVRRGARHLLLIGRTPEARLGAEAAALLGQLRAGGVDARYVSADCDDAAALAGALQVAATMPPVRGVVHGAGVVAPGMLAGAGPEHFAAMLRGKFSGAWWLHLGSRGWPLDFFVLLSSVSALWGTEGYGAYSAANGGLDAVAAHRAAAGLPGTSVAFGPWASGGIADAALREGLTRIGVGELTPAAGCASLVASGPDGAPLVVACPVDWPLFAAVMAVRRPRPLFSELTAGEGAGGGPAEAAAAAAIRSLPERARPAFASEHVERAVAAVLGHAEGEAVSRTTGLVDLGLDSVMTVDLARRLSGDFGVDVAVADVFNHPTVEELAGRVVELVTGAPESPPPVPAAGDAAAAAGDAAPAAAALPRAAAPPRPRQAEPAGGPVAIVGMAGRFPGADSVEELWQLLLDGGDGVGPVPADRWDGAALHDPDPLRTGTTVTDQGGFLRDVARFDAAFFGIPAREAESLDPQHRLLLESAWHALEDACIAPTSLAGTRTGVFVGISNADYAHLLEQGGLDQLDAYYSTGTALNAAAGRIAFLLGLAGPAIAVDTACSSSLVALHLAMRSLRHGEADCALAGGVNVIVSPVISVVASRAHMLSPDGRCKAFSAAADGYGRAEGCGVLVLKRLADAQRDGDRVIAVLHGSAVNQDGASSGLTVPSGRAQTAVIAAALADAGLQGASLSYLEAHGTGTPLGDPIEIGAAWAALGRDRRAGEPLLVGSIKSNIGHCESAAGVAGVIKTALALRHELLPANLHCETLNPHVAWRDMNVRVVDQPVRWRAGEVPRLAGVSGFGFSGTNAHVVVGEAPAPAADGTHDGPLVLPLSAPDGAGFARLAAAWERRLEAAGETELAALATTAGAGRAHHRVRRAVPGRTREELLAGVRAAAPEVAPARPPRVAFLFSGQGSQYFGMGRALYEVEPVFRDAMDACDRAVAGRLGMSLRELLYDGADRELVNQTRFTQPALVALELGLAALWASWGVTPAVVMGHSVGEIAAAIHAGVMSMEAGLALVAERGRLMQETAHGAMLAVSASPERVTGWLAGTELDVAALNGPESVVVAGAPDRVEAFAARLAEERVAARRLVVSHAFHSRLMEPMLAALEAAIAPLEFGPPAIPIVANVTGGLAAAGELDARYWVRHVRQPVRFHDGARQLGALGVDVCLEIGPDLTLGNLLLAAGLTPDGGAHASLRRGRRDRAVMIATAGSLYELGQDLRWGAVQAATGGARAAAPRYPFAPTRHWTRVRPPAAAPAAASPWGEELRSPALAGRAVAFQLGADRPRCLTDHRLYAGTVVVAGATQVATVATALAPGGSALTLEDVVWPRALVIGEGERYEVQVVTTDRDGTPRVTVQSQARPAGSAWEEHLSARLGQPDADRPPAPERAAFIASAERHLTGEACYAYMHGLGYALGGSFRWIADIWIRGDEALVRYEPPALPDDPDTFAIHPGLVDSCFQGPVGFAIDDEAVEGPTLAIPFAAARISLLARPKAGDELFGHVRLRESSPLPNGRRDAEVADLHLFTAEGTSVLIVERFRVRRAPRAVLERGPRVVPEHAYELTSAPLPEPSGPARGRTIVVRGGARPAARLRGALEHQGHDVRMDGNPAGGEIGADVDLVVDARFWLPGVAATAGGALESATRLAASLRRGHDRVPYAVLGEASAPAAPRREALWGLLAALEAESPDRRLLRVAVSVDSEPEDVAGALSRVLAGGLHETRLEVAGGEVRVARLAPMSAAAPAAASSGGTLITGGLGALGLSVARLLAARGARAITLMGRREPGTTAQRVIHDLAAAGVHVSVVRGDVTDPRACARAVAAAGEEAPLRRVLHLAGVVDDHAFQLLTDEAFATVFAAKARGAETLAVAVRGQRLDAFVLFSSIAAVLGRAGQVNYAAANGYLNGLAQALRAAGVPATSVSWGPWIPADGAGMAAPASAASRDGVRPLTDEEAAPLLDLAWASRPAAFVAAAADFDRFAEHVAGTPREPFVSLLAARSRPLTESRPPGGQAGPEAGWLLAELREQADPGRGLRDAIVQQVVDVLGDDEVDQETHFADLGLDSIMAIDLRNRLARALDVELPATAAMEHPTVEDLARHLAALVLAGEPAER